MHTINNLNKFKPYIICLGVVALIATPFYLQAAVVKRGKDISVVERRAQEFSNTYQVDCVIEEHISWDKPTYFTFALADVKTTYNPKYVVKTIKPQVQIPGMVYPAHVGTN